MPKPPKGPRLGGSPAHERLMLANLATALFRHGKITTTQTKARRLRPYAERLVTKAKRGDLHARRQVHAVIRDKEIVHELFATIGPNYAGRPGGYTRITKLGPRKGDSAPMAQIELVEPITAEQAAEAAKNRTEAKAEPKTEPAAKAEEPEAEAAEAAKADSADESQTQQSDAPEAESDESKTA